MTTVGRRVVPIGMRQEMRRLAKQMAARKTSRSLADLRTRSAGLKPGSSVRYRNFTIRVNDGLNFYMMMKDIFINRIYHFEARRANPVILDCGSNIGISILYFKQIYPRAQIVAFEPDASVVPYLRQNIAANGLTDVHLIEAGLGAREGQGILYSDARYGSSLQRCHPWAWRQESGRRSVSRRYACASISPRRSILSK